VYKRQVVSDELLRGGFHGVSFEVSKR
jgi:hypothetical protein